MLYKTGKTGFKNWTLSSDWKYLNGILVNDGSYGQYDRWLQAPYTNYAVEVEIQYVDPNNIGGSGVVARAVLGGGSPTGCWGGVSRYNQISGVAPSANDMCYLGNAGNTDGFILYQAFNPETEWHKYRIEV